MSEAVLFYDARCPACRLFARLVLAVDTERRIRTAPLDSAEADRLLGGLPKDRRFGSYHIVVGDRVASGGSGIGPLLEQTRLLRPAGRLVRRSALAARLASGAYGVAFRTRRLLARVLPPVSLPR
ncbi:MAG: DCC1-like thiol-disulfide oxidoreductase family protein [Actinomycetota bacterium]